MKDSEKKVNNRFHKSKDVLSRSQQQSCEQSHHSCQGQFQSQLVSLNLENRHRIQTYSAFQRLVFLNSVNKKQAITYIAAV